MMAGSEGYVGGCKGLEGDTELCSHQDLVICGGTRFRCNGKGNVGGDAGACYVFDSGVGEVNVGGICEGEVKGDGGVGNDQDFVVGVDKEVDLNGEFVESAAEDGEVVESAASGEVENGGVEAGENLESRDGKGLEIGESEGTVEDQVKFEVGEDLESRDGNGLEIGESEGTVEDQVKFEMGEDLESRDGNGLEIGETEEMVVDQVKFEVEEDLESRDGNGLEIGESEGTVEDQVKFEVGEDLESRDGNGLEIGESEGTVEDQVKFEVGEDLESRDGNGLEIGESEGTVEDQVKFEVGEDLESRDGNGLEIGESEGTVEDQVMFEVGEDLDSQDGNGLVIGESEGKVIVLEVDGKLLDKSVRGVEQDIVVSVSEVGESEKSDAVALVAAECGLGKVEAGIGEEVSQKPTKLKSVEGDLESRIRISDDSLSCELVKDQNNFEQTKDLSSDAELGESQEGVIKAEDTCEIDKSVTVGDQDFIASPADFREGNQSHTVASWADICELEEIQVGIEVDVGEGNSKELTELNSVEESLESQIRITESVDCVSQDLEENQDKSKLMTDLDSEIDGGVQLGSQTNAVVDNGIICAASAGDFKVGRDKDLDECINESQSVDKLDLTPSNAANLCSMDEVPVKCGEKITAGTDDCAAVEHEASRSVVVQEIGAVNSIELDSNINKTYVVLVEHVSAKVFESVLASIDDGTASDQGPVDADCGVGLVQGYEAQRVAHDTDDNGTLTTETATRSVKDQSKITQINLGEQKSDCIKSPELNGIPDDAHYDCIEPQVQSDEMLQSDCNGATITEPEVKNLVCPITDNKSELDSKLNDSEDVEIGIFSVTDDTKSENGVANGLSSCASNDVKSEMKIEFGTIDSAEIVSKSWGHNSPSKPQVLNGVIECNRKQDIYTTDSVKSGSCADMSFKSDVQNRSATNHSDMPGKDATVAERSIGDSVDGQGLGNVAKAKPFLFLAKFPRIDDDKIRERIRDTQLLVEDKTVVRDNIKCEIDITRANLQSLGDKFEATKSDERAARRLVKLKRQEIDSVQDKINRVKNSISVMDITNRIAHLEHMIEHETHPLKEEKQLLHEINVMKKLRGQISSNVCPEEEVTQALSQIEPTEMQLKTLKKELGDLKDKVSKAEAAVILLGKEYNNESKRLRELQARFRAANDIRQDAYKDLLGLKRQLHEKSKHYWMYKDDAKAASDYALNQDKEALYRLCFKQVDTFMNLWNKNDEFREDYVRCNMKSTIRRLKTLDGRSLGPDEEVRVPVYVGEREVRQLYNPSRTTNLSSPTILKQENTAQLDEREQIDGNSLVAGEPKSKTLKPKYDNPIPESGLHVGSGQLEAEETKEEEKQQTKEELELAIKAEISRKEEIAAKLKEQLRHEEKVKAQEALERKKRNAEKAQMRAVLRAQKEAEQKEKEREKRLRKKEKKNSDGEIAVELETNQTNHIKDENKDSTPTKPSKPSHFNKYSKAKATIPPALRNRGKRRLKQVMWWICGGLIIVLIIFLVWNGGA